MEEQPCHICGNSHPSVMTPFPDYPIIDKPGWFHCPHDVTGRSTYNYRDIPGRIAELIQAIAERPPAA